MYNIRRNSVYYEIAGNGLFSGSINYDRLFPISNKTGFVLRGGLAYYEELLLVAELDFLVGGRKHFFELGFGTTFHVDRAFPLIRAGYRYQGMKGLLIRVTPQLLIDDVDHGFLWGGLSAGYAF